MTVAATDTPTPTPAPTDSAVAPAAPAEPIVFDPIGFLATYPLLLPILVIGAMVGLHFGWKRLTLMYNIKGQPLAPLKQTLSTARRIMFKEDTFPVFIRNEKLAAKFAWLTWVRYWQIATVAFLAIVLVGSRLPWGIGNVLLGAILLIILAGVGHVRKVFAYRHRVLMQMFEVANGEMRYTRGAELNPWAYIQVADWHDLYSPGTTTVMFPAKYRSEDPRNRQAFEINFNGTVSDQHTWAYTWESSNNRVICEPVPFISDRADYPFPDRNPWDIFPLGQASAGQEAVWNVSVFPHMLIAGTTGSGKSVTQRTILLHALQSPDWRIVLVDPKMVELSEYRGHPNVLRVATELADSMALIEQVEQEMMSRYARMKDIGGVNHFRNLPDPPPAVLLMVDETFALLSPSGVKSDEGKEQDAQKARIAILIGNIARLGRAAGVHMVLATQRPDAKVLPGEVKALALDTPIATPSGWSTMGELNVGDQVFDETGAVTNVTAVTDVMYDHDVYEVVFSDGEIIVADAGHLWLTHDAEYRRLNGHGVTPAIVNTRTMAATTRLCGTANHAIPAARALQTAHLDTVVDLYTVGLSGSQITQAMLRASAAQRLALLHGMMDRAGKCLRPASANEGATVLYPAPVDQADMVIELVRTLGYRPMTVTRPASSERRRVDIAWTAAEPMFRDQQKLALQQVSAHQMSGKVAYRYVVSVRPVPTVPVRCIAVDSPSRLYLAGRSFVPTHNSNLDARIAQGRMDSIPSMMTLDSDAATRIPPVKGRAMLRVGNDFTEFQAYFLPMEHLPQVLEMSAAIAQGDTSFLDDPEPAAETPSDGGAGFTLPKLSFLRRDGKVWQWLERRKALMEENERRAGRLDQGSDPGPATPSKASSKAKSKKAVEAPEPPKVSAARSDVSIDAVAAEAYARAVPLDIDPLFQRAVQPSDVPSSDGADDPFGFDDDLDDERGYGEFDDEFSGDLDDMPVGPVSDSVPAASATPVVPATPAAAPTPTAVPGLAELEDDASAVDEDFAGYVDDLGEATVEAAPVFVGVPGGPVPETATASISVHEVMRRAAERGVPIPASELLAALRAEAYRQQLVEQAGEDDSDLADDADDAGTAVAPAAAPAAAPLPVRRPSRVIPAPPTTPQVPVARPAPPVQPVDTPTATAEPAAAPVRPVRPAGGPVAPAAAPVAPVYDEWGDSDDRADEKPVEAPWMPPLPPPPVNRARSPFAQPGDERA